MLTLTYRDVRHPDFPKAIRKLAECSDIKSVAVLLRIVKAYGAIVAAEKECLDVQKKLYEQYGTKQEDGTTKLVNPEDFEKGLEELLKTPFEIDIDAFKFNDLLPAKLSAVDVNALGCLVVL